MARSSNSRKRRIGSGWVLSLLGAAILICGGFLVGLVAGVVSQEPELVVGHLAGRGEEVPWSARPEPEPDPIHSPPDVAAPPPAGTEAARHSPSGKGPAEQGSPESSNLRSAGSESARSASDAGATGAGFSVQVGAFSSSAVAERLANTLLGKGFPAFVVPAPRSGDERWRVRVGPLASKGEADRIARRLKVEERLPTWVLAEGGH